MHNKVSIIIPTKNSEVTIQKCLESVIAQSYSNIEIVIVDNYSIDKTLEISKKYTPNIFVSGPERSAQVNYGVKQATGDFVYRVDSDFVLDKDVVKQCIEKIHKGYDAVVVHNTPDETISWIAKVRKFEIDMYKNNLGHSSARFFKKEVFKNIGGFNEKIIAGEDYDIQNRLNSQNFKTGFIEAEALHLGEPTSFLPHMLKFYMYGKDFVNYTKFNESTAKLGFFRKEYFKNWRKFIYNPGIGFLFIIYNICKYAFGSLGYIVASVLAVTKNSMKLILFYLDLFIRSLKLDISFLKIKLPIGQKIIFILKKYILIIKNFIFGFTVGKDSVYILGRNYFFDEVYGTAVLQSVFVDNTPLERYIKENSVVIDVGGNIGQFAIFLKRYLKAKKVYSFEPSKTSFELLKLNSTEEVFNFAISKEKELKLYTPFKNSSTASIFSVTHEDIEEKVVGVRLDDIVEIQNEPVIDLLKIDTEGSELSVLQVSTNTLAKSKYILVELSLNRPSSGGVIDVITFLKEQIPSLEIVYFGRQFFDKGVSVAIDVLFRNNDLIKNQGQKI